MYTLYRLADAAYWMVSINSRASATLLLDAPSISRTSIQFPDLISSQKSHWSQGSGLGPFSQLIALARIRAVVVFHTPRVPENK